MTKWEIKNTEQGPMWYRMGPNGPQWLPVVGPTANQGGMHPAVKVTLIILGVLIGLPSLFCFGWMAIGVFAGIGR